MTSGGSVKSVVSLVRNGEDIVTEHWYDPASARVRAENCTMGSDVALTVVRAPPAPRIRE